MLTYSICPIAVCQGQQDGSQFTYQANYGKTFKNASYAWYIKGSQQKILVDTGARASTFRKKGVTSEIDLITVENGLAKLGLTPEDIDIVIITHLHGDHIELASLYKKAQFIIQKNYSKDSVPAFVRLGKRKSHGRRRFRPGVAKSTR